MGVTTFAAINIGSYELTMKIYELGGRKKTRVIDSISYRLDLGRDTYTSGKISFGKMSELCEQLIRFKEIMAAYQTDAYRICTTSAIREADNPRLILDQIKAKTGLKCELLSNSEQRFLQYKALATKDEYFSKMIHKRTAVTDIGGGSLQMSLFDNEKLVATQNIRLGAVRIKELLVESSYRSTKYITMIEDLIENDIEAFDRLYIQGAEIQNMILMGEVSTRLIQAISGREGLVSSSQYLEFYDKTISKTPERIGAELGILADYSQMIYPVMVMIKTIMERTGAVELWAPGLNLCDGMMYDYAISKSLIPQVHNFEEDIIAEADNTSRRYMCNQEHTDKVRQYAVAIFDAMKKVHGLGKRERLLLEIIAMLHDCGKYISLTHAPESSYNIIMSTEIIGLSHLEREIVAYSVLYNNLRMEGQEQIVQSIGEKAYLTVYKLCAILKLANVLDRSHRQKIEKFRVAWKDGELVISVHTKEEFALEKQMFEEKARFFEEAFCVKPVLRARREW